MFSIVQTLKNKNKKNKKKEEEEEEEEEEDFCPNKQSISSKYKLY